MSMSLSPASSHSSEPASRMVPRSGSSWPGSMESIPRSTRSPVRSWTFLRTVSSVGGTSKRTLMWSVAIQSPLKVVDGRSSHNMLLAASGKVAARPCYTLHELDLLRETPAGLFCEPGGFHLDPALPVERAVITHAHADHARPGSASYLCAGPALPLLQRRLRPDA